MESLENLCDSPKKPLMNGAKKRRYLMNKITEAIDFCVDLIEMGMVKQDAVNICYDEISDMIFKDVFIDKVQIAIIDKYIQTTR
jgi:hypothetical protein